MLDEFMFATDVDGGVPKLIPRFDALATLAARTLGWFLDQAAKPVFITWGFEILPSSLRFSDGNTNVVSYSMPESIRLRLPRPATGDLGVGHDDPRMDRAVRDKSGVLALVVSRPIDPRHMGQQDLVAASQAGRLLAGWCVNGHLELPTDGQVISPLADMKAPR